MVMIKTKDKKRISRTNIVRPRIEDLGVICGIEHSGWNSKEEGMVANQDALKNRIKLGTIDLLEHDGIPSGIISYQNPSWINSETIAQIMGRYGHSGFLPWNEIVQEYNLPRNLYEATNGGFIKGSGVNTHDPTSDCTFLIGVTIIPEKRGFHLVDYLVENALNVSRDGGKKFAIGYARIPCLSKEYENPTIDEVEAYLREKKQGTELPRDLGARFHVRNGGKVVSVIPEVMEDTQSRNYGFLVVYDLR